MEETIGTGGGCEEALGEEVAATGEGDGAVERQHPVGGVVRVRYHHAIGAAVFFTNNKMRVGRCDRSPHQEKGRKVATR